MAGRQYTFKTTKDTEWLEPIFDKASSNGDRSVLIRNLITLGLRSLGMERDEVSSVGDLLSQYTDSNVTPNVRPKVTPDVTQQVTPNVRPKVTPDKPPTIDLGDFKEEELDIDSLNRKLDSLDF